MTDQQIATTPPGTKTIRVALLYSLGWQHWFAGVLLLLFAISHFLMFKVDAPVQNSVNTVFPFVTNRTMNLVAGLLELIVAFVCIRQRGRDLANIAILIFLAVIIWYRYAVSFTSDGIKSCDCLGVFGQAFHLNKTQERVIPLIVLALLCLTIVPWLIRVFGAVVGSWRRPQVVAQKLVLMVVFCFSAKADAQDTIEVSGQYQVLHYNTATGDVFKEDTVNASFLFTLSGNTWSIYATNLATSGEGLMRTPWEGVIYDGKDTYTLTPGYKDRHGKMYPVRATISPGPIFLRDYDEWLDFDVIWLTYGLSPRDIPPNTNGIVEIPLPWYNARSKAFAYGAEWKIKPSEDGRFMSECLVVANTNLDLSLKEELLRPTVNYPYNLESRNHYTEFVQLRRQQLPQGFVELTYQCPTWFATNGTALPMASEVVRNESRWRTNYPLSRGIVKASGVTVRKGPERLLPEAVPQETLVADYRYRKVTENKILPYVEYVLAAGDLWKSANDASVARKAEAMLKTQAPQLDHAGSKRKSYLTWIFLALLLFPIVIWAQTTHRNKKQERQS